MSRVIFKIPKNHYFFEKKFVHFPLMKKVLFPGRILVLGCGGVSRCTLPLLLEHLDMPFDRMTVMDMMDLRSQIPDVLKAGVNYVQEKIVQETMGIQLAQYVGRGDIIIDLAWNIGCTDILQWCHDNGVLYMNTSVELWDPYTDAESKTPQERTLYPRHMAIRKMVGEWDDIGPTAVLEHGANPGLVSHFTKQALTDIAKKILTEKSNDPRNTSIETFLNDRAYSRLAQVLNVRVIHISEIDTQVSNMPRDPNVFANTWSVEGLREEGIAPAEMGWGTHEKALPDGAHLHSDGPKNQICLDSFGINTFVKSRVPSRDIVAMVIRHGEAFTLSDHLTVWDSDTAIYRPTVHYAYCPSRETWASLEDMRANNYQLQDNWRIMGDDITSGVDELGVLLMGHDFRSWWTGTILGIDEARSLVPNQNATTLQVAASVIACVLWMIEHPNEGVLVPDQLPHEAILDIARPYLGKIVSDPIDWTPTGKAPVGNGSWRFHKFQLKKENPQAAVGKSFAMEEAAQ